MCVVLSIHPDRSSSVFSSFVGGSGFVVIISRPQDYIPDCAFISTYEFVHVCSRNTLEWCTSNVYVYEDLIIIVRRAFGRLTADIRLFTTGTLEKLIHPDT